MIKNLKLKIKIFFQAPRQLRTARTGFTMIELLVVSVIIVMLLSIGLVAYRRSAVAARDKRREEDIHQIQTALELYYDDNGNYPTASSVNALLNVSGFTQYLQRGVIEDPINSSTYRYTIDSTSTRFSLQYRRESDGVQVSVDSTGGQGAGVIPTATAVPNQLPTINCNGVNSPACSTR